MTITRQTPKATQTDTIRAHLLAGESISTWVAYQSYNITCLAQRIHELRNTGLPIDSEMVMDADTGKRYSLYWLNTDYLNNQLDEQPHIENKGRSNHA